MPDLNLEGKFTVTAKVVSFTLTHDAGKIAADIKTPQIGDTVTVYMDTHQPKGQHLHLTWRGMSTIKRGRMVAEVSKCITHEEDIARKIKAEGL